MARILRWWTPRRLIIAALVMLLALTSGVVAARWWVNTTAADYRYGLNDAPSSAVVMVLGARVDPDGNPSRFLEARLRAALELYETDRAEAILVSGDNRRDDYNEVDPMRDWLIDRQVPQSQVIGDYAGVDTYDSCVRAREVFGVREMTVVTQSFHVDRAVTLCRNAGIEAIGVGDETGRDHARSWRYGTTREYLANVKAAMDVLVGRDPALLGPYESSVDEAIRRG